MRERLNVVSICVLASVLGRRTIYPRPCTEEAREKGRAMRTRNFYWGWIASATFVLLLNGCSAVKRATPMGGSRADGTIEMGYEQGEFQTVEIDWATADREAKARCQSWGYTDAQRFGGMKRVCNQPGGFSGCARHMVSVQYQCLGDDIEK